MYRWSYTGKLKKHNIDIQHDTEGGSFRLYLNGTLLIEEHVKSDKSFPLVIDGMPCSLVVTRTGDEYEYEFKEERILSGRKILSPKEKENRKETYALLITGAIILLILAGATFLYLTSKDKKLASLEEKGTIAMAKIYHDGNGDFHKEKRTLYVFPADGRAIVGKIDVPVNDAGFKTIPAGLPLNVGDEFEVLYLPGDPEISQLKLDTPSPGQLQAYKDQLAGFLIGEYGLEGYEEGKVNEFVYCILNLVNLHYGLKGFADILYKNVNSNLNPLHNKQTFERMKSSGKYMQIEKTCLEQAQNSIITE